jgi:hypothetical protein
VNKVILVVFAAMVVLLAVNPILAFSASEEEFGTENEPGSSGVVITPFQFEHYRYSNAVPMDWSPDGKTVLIQYGTQNEDQSLAYHGLAIANADLSNVTELTFLHSFPLGYATVDANQVFVSDPAAVALFSPAYGEDAALTNWEIFFQWKDQLYAYSIDDGRLEKLLDGVTYFDVMSSPERLLYSNYDGENSRISTLSIDTRQSEVVLEEATGLYTFDLSPDDSRIIYKDDGESISDNKHLAYYDLASGERNTIPNVGFGCSFTPRWTAGGSNYVIIEGNDCATAHGGWTGASLSVASLDGKTDTELVAESIDNPSKFVISPDGRSLLVKLDGPSTNGTLSSVGEGHMYRLDYATVIPEFNHIAGLLMAAGIVGSVIATRYHIKKHKK